MKFVLTLPDEPDDPSVVKVRYESFSESHRVIHVWFDQPSQFGGYLGATGELRLFGKNSKGATFFSLTEMGLPDVANWSYQLDLTGVPDAPGSVGRIILWWKNVSPEVSIYKAP